jgi:hypothetical protein
VYRLYWLSIVIMRLSLSVNGFFPFQKPAVRIHMVDDRLGRTGTLVGLHSGNGMNPDERRDGGRVGLSPSFSIHAHASLKFLVNIVGSDLLLTSSLTWPAARK